jgi:hypothetical protein
MGNANRTTRYSTSLAYNGTVSNPIPATTLIGNIHRKWKGDHPSATVSTSRNAKISVPDTMGKTTVFPLRACARMTNMCPMVQNKAAPRRHLPRVVIIFPA